jgi:hypothetical protein
MAKVIPYDVSNVEEGGGGGGEVAPPGVYVAEIKIFEQRDTKANGDPANDIRIALNVGDRFDWLFTYVGLGDSTDWKLKELISALNLKDKGQMNPDKLKGKLIRVKVNPDTWEGAPKASAGRLMKAQPEDTEPGPVSGPAMALATGAAGSAAENGGGDGEEYTPEGAADGFEPTREDAGNEEIGLYDEWPEEDLKQEVEERGLTVPGGRGKMIDKLIKALRADDEESGGDEETTPEDPEASAEEPPEDDYDTWEVPELEKEVADRMLDPVEKPRGRGAQERYKAALIEAMRKDDIENPFNPEAEE